MSASIDHPTVCYKSLDEDRLSVSSERSRTWNEDVCQGVSILRSSALSNERKTLNDQSDSRVIPTGGQQDLSQPFSPFQHLQMASSGGGLPNHSSTFSMLGVGHGNSSPQCTPNKFTIQDPLPSGQFTISPQHPQVIIPSVKTPIMSASLLKNVECREQSLDFESMFDTYQYSESPDTVLNAKAVNKSLFLAGYEGQDQSMLLSNGMQQAAVSACFDADQAKLLSQHFGGAAQQALVFDGSVSTIPGYDQQQQQLSFEMKRGRSDLPAPVPTKAGIGARSLSNVMISQVLSPERALSYNTQQAVYNRNRMRSCKEEGLNMPYQPYLPNAMWTAPSLAISDEKEVGATEEKLKKTQAAKRQKTSSPASDTTSSKQRTSKYRGVSRHRLTRRWEASCWVKKRQLYLGGFDSEEKAARAYDVAALVCKGIDAPINFELKDYLHHIQLLRHCTQEELVAHIRRQSSAFSRGKSKYRGVSGTSNRWEARIGQYEGRKNVSFGVYETEEEAARQYDRALIIQRGRSAKTNFNIFLYQTEIFEYEKYIDSLPEEKRQEARKNTSLPMTQSMGSEEAIKKKGGGGSNAATIYAEDVKKALNFSPGSN